MAQGGQNLVREPNSFVDRERPLSVHLDPKRLSLDMRGHVVQPAIVATGVEEREDVRVVQSGDRLDLTKKAMLDVLEKVYGRNETDLTFKEMLQMEAYMISFLASIGADYQLFKDGIVDEQTWSARLQLLAAIVSAEWTYQHWKAMPWVDPDLLAAVESVRGSPEISQYLEAIDSSIGRDGV